MEVLIIVLFRLVRVRVPRDPGFRLIIPLAEVLRLVSLPPSYGAPTPVTVRPASQNPSSPRRTS
jgi:hypothetical protein